MRLCSAWLDGSDVADCCSVEDASDPSIFDSAAEVASEILFNLSLRRYPGICERTVRPCRTGCGCPWQILSRGYVIWNPNWIGPWGGPGWSCSSDVYGAWCGCQPLSRTLLAGYVQEIVEILIDGAVVDPNTYRVDRHRWLVRTRELDTDPFPNWPGCQDLTLPETETGTWAVTYTYGNTPPASGVDAAAELACEFYKQCNGQPCALPKNTSRVIRQGIVVEKPAFTSWGFERGGRSIPRGWQTGMPKVDAFLNASNPTGLTRLPIFWSPAASLKYAQPVGLDSSGT